MNVIQHACRTDEKVTLAFGIYRSYFILFEEKHISFIIIIELLFLYSIEQYVGHVYDVMCFYWLFAACTSIRNVIMAAAVAAAAVFLLPFKHSLISWFSSVKIHSFKICLPTSKRQTLCVFINFYWKL